MKTLNRVRADRASAIEPQLAALNAADRQTLVDAVTVLRRALEDARQPPRDQARPASCCHCRSAASADDLRSILGA